jgi:hypothetical protein
MQKATIDVDLGELAKDWEAVAFRAPKKGDSCVDTTGKLYPVNSDYDFRSPRLIVRRKFQWPSWCKAAAICMDKDGTWYAFNPMPERSDKRGRWEPADRDFNGIQYMLLEGHECCLDVQLPANHDWTVPLLNPNYKAGGDE